MIKDWYSPGEVRFDRKSTLWLIQNLATLRGGHWPTEARSYVDVYTRLLSHKSPFATPIEYVAEIESRLEECGLDGLILEAIEGWDKSEISLSKYLKMPVWSIRKRANNALAYVASGPNRRWHNTPKRKGKSYREYLKKEEKHATDRNIV